MKPVLIYITTLLCCISCTPKRTYFPRTIAPVSVSILRFDQALMNVQSSTVKQDVRVLYEQYPTFMPFYMEEVLGISAYDTAYLEEALPAFLEDTMYGFAQTNQYEKSLFASTQDIEQALNKAFSRIHYLYPELPIPAIYFFVSGFNASILFVDEDMAVGADMYLGADYAYYNRVVYEYQKLTMCPSAIPIDVASAYLFRHLPYTSAKSRLLENMIYRGKMMYILAQIFDTLPPYEVMGYTKQQWQWCEKHEQDIWNLMMDKRDLFKTESLLLTSYLNDGPFTAEISQSSPGRLGTWIGWRIVESYMNHQPDVTLQQLAADGDAENILQRSYYKP